MGRREILRTALAAGVVLGGISPEVTARGTEGLDEKRGEQVRVLDPVAEVTRLMESQMNGWTKDCRLATPKKTLTGDEQRIYDRASNCFMERSFLFLLSMKMRLICILPIANQERNGERRHKRR